MAITITVQFEMDDDHGDPINVEVVGKYWPGEPPPRCSNPDRAAYGEPGDGSIMEILSAYYADKPHHAIPEKLRLSARFLEHALHAADESFAKGEC